MWTNPLVPCFQGRYVWTNGPESSSKVSPETGVGPWTALPSHDCRLAMFIVTFVGAACVEMARFEDLELSLDVRLVAPCG